MGNKGASCFLFALDGKNGKILWSTKVGRPGGNLGCTPAVDGDRVYGIGQEGDLVCLDTKTGSVHWRKNFQKHFGGHYGGWHYTESPLVDGDKVVGTIGSAAVSPAYGPIALALVRREAEPGAVLTAGEAGATATVVELPRWEGG